MKVERKDFKETFPPMIVRFPEDRELARFDRWLSLRLMSIPWGPLATVVLVAGHLFTSPWNAVGTVPLVVLAMEAPWPCNGLALAAAFFSLYPMLLILKDELKHHAFFTGSSFVIAVPALLLSLWALDTSAFQVSCLYCSSWMYTTLLTYLLKRFAGRRRPLLAMKDSVAGMRRLPFWMPWLLQNGEGDNAYLSFPSGDAAAAGCLAGAMRAGSGEASCLALALAALAMYGRVYIFAHHLSDVVCGAVVGFLCTASFAASAPRGSCHVLLAWSMLCVSSMGALLVVGPLRAVPVLSALLLLLRLYAGMCWTIPAFYVLLAAAAHLLFVKTSFDQKRWVMETLEEFFASTSIQDSALPPPLLGAMERKREELRARAADPNSPFPSNIYSLYAYSPRLGLEGKPFAAGWDDLSQFMAVRLEDLAKQTGLKLNTVDVVLGIYTGGALLAPLVASKLGCGTCYIRISRYADDVLGMSGSLTTMLQKVTGRHDRLYQLTSAPDRALLRGKTVLMVDDAVGTGGTFRAAHKFCMQAGALQAKGVALDTILPGRHIWDPALPNPAPQNLIVPCFLPWGLR